MSAAIPGHGYRETVRILPGCKCGWQGHTTDDPAEARGQFETHKHWVRQPRHRTGFRPNSHGGLEVVR